MLFIVQNFTIGSSTPEEILFKEAGAVVEDVVAEEDLRNRSSRRRQDCWISEDTRLREKPVVLISMSSRASWALWGRRDVPVTDIVNGVVIFFGETTGRMMKDGFGRGGRENLLMMI
jgi:hypothetical protein